MLPPLLLLGALAGPPAACVDDFGCSLNGVCAGGRCRCDAAWRGARCGALNLLPAKPRNGYGGLNSTTSSWGGGAAFDPATGKYAMVVSEFDRHCGLVSYHHNSRCVLAEADSPSGPYEPVAVLVDANCMGTTTARDPRTGAWLFSGYHVNQSECLLCSGGVTPDLPKHAEGKAGPCSRGVGAVDTKNALLARSGSRGPWRDAGPGVPNVGADVQPFFSANGSFFISESMSYPGTSSCCINQRNGSTSGSEWCDRATNGNSTSFVSLRVAASLADGLAGRWSENLIQSWVAADNLTQHRPCFNWEGALPLPLSRCRCRGCRCCCLSSCHSGLSLRVAEMCRLDVLDRPQGPLPSTRT
jgi:hypothetical protein